MVSSSSPSWSSWAGTNGEILRYVSFFDASSAGNGLWWAQLSADKTINADENPRRSAMTIPVYFICRAKA